MKDSDLRIGWVAWKNFACCIHSGEWMKPFFSKRFHFGKWVIALGQGKSSKPLALIDCFNFTTKKEAGLAIKEAIEEARKGNFKNKYAGKIFKKGE